MIPAAAVSDPIVAHASTVAVDGRGLLIVGPSGAGKSALALALMALGAGLVADDRTILTRRGDQVIAACPDGLAGMIEARGIGLLRAATHGPVALSHVIDLTRIETDRMPPIRHYPVMGVALDLVLAQNAAHFPFMVMQLLRGGRVAEGAQGDAV